MKKTMGMMLSVLLIPGLFSGCWNGEDLKELDRLRSGAALEERNVEIVKRYVKLFNQGNFESLKEILSPEYAVFSPSGITEARSRERLIEGYEGARAAFNAFRWDLKDIFASGDRVACRIVAAGTTKPGIPGLTAEATDFEFSMMTILRLENGLIVEEWQEDDQLGFTRQLNMELKPKSD